MGTSYKFKNNIKFAHVGSLGTYRILSSLGDFDMFLAPLILRDCNYANFCKQQSVRRHTILNSGALELTMGTEATNIKDGDFLDIAFILKVSEIVCPDTPDDPKFSLIRTKDFIKNCCKKYKQILPNLMVVPHGKNLEEWFKNAGELIDLVGKCTVGVPRLLVENCKSEYPGFRVNVAQKLKQIYPHILIHLLGAGKQFHEELLCIRKTNTIRSLDSTFIHRYSTSNYDSFEQYVPPKVLNNKSTPVDFVRKATGITRYINNIVLNRSENV